MLRSVENKASESEQKHMKASRSANTSERKQQEEVHVDGYVQLNYKEANYKHGGQPEVHSSSVNFIRRPAWRPFASSKYCAAAESDP
jgi:hypothetical protein